MATRSELRKKAYQYILFLLGNLPDTTSNNGSAHFVSLEELRQIKEGVADPSLALVASLKELLQGMINSSTIDSHLVAPFRNYKSE